MKYLSLLFVAFVVLNSNHSIAARPTKNACGGSYNIFPDIEQIEGMRRGRELKDQGRLEEATDVLVKLLERYPRDAYMHTLLGKIYLERRLWDLGIHHLLEVVIIEKPSARNFMDLATGYRDAGRYEQALEVLDRSVFMFPNDYISRGLRSQILLKLGKLEEALKETDAILALKPDDTIALYTKSELLLNLNRPEEALQLAQAALQQSRYRSPNARLAKIRALLKLKRYEQAEKIFESLEETVSSMELMAQVQIGLEQWSRARFVADRLLMHDPQNYVGLKTKVYALMMEAKNNEAQSTLKLALAIYSEDRTLKRFQAALAQRQ